MRLATDLILFCMLAAGSWNIALAQGAGLEGALGNFVDRTLATDDPLVLAAEGERLDATEAAALETQLKLRESNPALRSQLLGYYFSHHQDPKDAARRFVHLRWLISSGGASELAGSKYAALDPRGDPAETTCTLQAWLDAVAARPVDERLVRNAADSLAAAAPAESAKLYAHGEDLQPGEPQWPARLGASLVRAGQAAPGMAAYARALSKVKTADAERSLLSEAALAALMAGDAARTEEWSRRLLELAMASFPIDADAIHRARTLLGLAALNFKGDVAAAKRELAGSTIFPPGSKLTLAEPYLELANALLDRGERAAVADFLLDCKSRWPRHAERIDALIAGISNQTAAP